MAFSQAISMVCARCGSEVPAAAGRCPRCAAPVEQTVATGVLTPPPPPGDDETAIGLTGPQTALTGMPGEPATLRPVDSPSLNDAATNVVGGALFDPEEAATVLGDAPAAGRIER